MFRLQRLSPWCSSSASALARIMASGVFISWPASVMNCFCRAMLSAMSLVARRESSITASSAASQQPAPASSEERRDREYGPPLVRHVQEHGEAPLPVPGFARCGI